MAKLDCKLCGGTGWVVREQDGISSADRCSCVAEARAEGLEVRAQIPTNYRSASFDSFLIPRDNPVVGTQLSSIQLQMRSFVRNYPKTPKRGLLIVGPSGAGKTHLAVAALRELISLGHEGIFFDYQGLLERIRAGYSETLGTSNREAYRIALETEILLLDDLGAHRAKDWVEDTVTSIITHRCNHHKSLIATTNLPDSEMGAALTEKSELPGGHSYRISLAERIGERARSRLFEMCTVVRLWGINDYRVKPPRQ